MQKIQSCMVCCSMQGDLLLFAAGPPAVVNAALDKVRQFLAAELNEIPADSHAITWITDWPMFESSEEDGRLQVSFCNSGLRLERLSGQSILQKDKPSLMHLHCQLVIWLFLRGLHAGSTKQEYTRLSGR